MRLAWWFCFVLALGWVAPGNATAALVAHYPFNGSGNDATGTNTNLTLMGDAGYGASVSAGLGTALSLDGDGDGAIGQGFVKVTTNNLTVVAWAYATSLDGDWNSIVKNWGENIGGQFHFGLGNVAVNKLQSIASGASTAADPADLPQGQWVHTAFVLDSATLQHHVYINGAVVATAAYTGTLGLGSATGLGVGHKPNDDGTALSGGGGPGPWNGLIDDVGIYNEALSTAQIEQIYQNGLAGTQLDGTMVPEPQTLFLAVLAGLVMVGSRRRES